MKEGRKEGALYTFISMQILSLSLTSACFFFCPFFTAVVYSFPAAMQSAAAGQERKGGHGARNNVAGVFRRNK